MGNAEKIVSNPNNPIPNNVPFTSDRQPTPEQKKAGWEKKKKKQRIMDQMEKIDTMSMKELDDTIKDIEKNPENYSVEFATLLRYRRNMKFIVDWLDRSVGKAQQDIDITSEGEKIEGIKVEIINPRDDSES